MITHLPVNPSPPPGRRCAHPVRYIQATRPGSRQVAVDIEPELMGFVTDRLPLPAVPTASWWSVTP